MGNSKTVTVTEPPSKTSLYETIIMKYQMTKETVFPLHVSGLDFYYSFTAIKTFVYGSLV